MNGIETKTPRPRRPVQRRLTPEERAEIIKRRRRKKRIQKIKKLVAFVLCAVVVAVCMNIAVKELMKDDAISIVQNSTSDEQTKFRKKTQDTKPQSQESAFKKKEPEAPIPQKVSTEFSAFPYYVDENAERYEAYATKNPHLSAEDVVWMVNAHQDKPKYGYDIPTSGYDVKIIVNKYYKVPDNYKPSDLVKVDGQQVRQVAADAFRDMQRDAASRGLKIRVVSGYRSVEYQRGLYNRYLSNDSQESVDRYSARPGYSEHHTGLAIDLFGSKDGLRQFETTPEYPWVRDNCYKYGFIIRYLEETESITGYEDEPWHLRYVGVDVSTDMKEKNINNYEEYYAKYLLK